MIVETIRKYKKAIAAAAAFVVPALTYYFADSGVAAIVVGILAEFGVVAAAPKNEG